MPSKDPLKGFVSFEQEAPNPKLQAASLIADYLNDPETPEDRRKVLFDTVSQTGFGSDLGKFEVDPEGTYSFTRLEPKFDVANFLPSTPQELAGSALDVAQGALQGVGDIVTGLPQFASGVGKVAGALNPVSQGQDLGNMLSGQPSTTLKTLSDVAGSSLDLAGNTVKNVYNIGADIANVGTNSDQYARITDTALNQLGQTIAPEATRDKDIEAAANLAPDVLALAGSIGKKALGKGVEKALVKKLARPQTRIQSLRKAVKPAAVTGAVNTLVSPTDPTLNSQDSLRKRASNFIAGSAVGLAGGYGANRVGNRINQIRRNIKANKLSNQRIDNKLPGLNKKGVTSGLETPNLNDLYGKQKSVTKTSVKALKARTTYTSGELRANVEELRSREVNKNKVMKRSEQRNVLKSSAEKIVKSKSERALTAKKEVVNQLKARKEKTKTVFQRAEEKSDFQFGNVESAVKSSNIARARKLINPKAGGGIEAFLKKQGYTSNKEIKAKLDEFSKALDEAEAAPADERKSLLKQAKENLLSKPSADYSPLINNKRIVRIKAKVKGKQPKPKITLPKEYEGLSELEKEDVMISLNKKLKAKYGDRLSKLTPDQLKSESLRLLQEEYPDIKIEKQEKPKYLSSKSPDGKVSFKDTSGKEKSLSEATPDELEALKRDEKQQTIQEHKEDLQNQTGASKEEVDAYMNQEKVTGKASSMDPSPMVNIVESVLSKTQLNSLGNTISRFKESARSWGQQFNLRLQFRDNANKKYSEFLNFGSKELGIKKADFKTQHLENGKFRDYLETGGTKNLTPVEISAYKKLKQSYNKYQTDVVIPLLMEAMGNPQGVSFDPSKVSDASRGKLKFTFDVTNVPESVLEKSGVTYFEDGGRKTVVIGYGDSFVNIVDSIEKGRESYYEKRYPWMFTNGKFNVKDLYQEKNPHSNLIDLLNLSVGKDLAVGEQLERQLLKSGYSADDIQKIKSDYYEANSGTISTYDLSQKAYKLFVGSLQKDKGIKLSVNLDPFSTVRDQTIQLGQKLTRDSILSDVGQLTLRESKKVQDLESQRFNLGTKQGREDYAKNKAEVRQAKRNIEALEYTKALVTNKPIPILGDLDRLMSDLYASGSSSLLKADPNSPIAKGAKALGGFIQKSPDALLKAMSVAKMAGSVSAGIANGLQGAIYAATQIEGLGDLKLIAEKRWANPISAIKAVDASLKEMFSDPYYGKLYSDFNIDPEASLGQKSLDTFTKASLGANRGGVRFGQAMVYDLAAMKADAQGLTGEARSNFIYDKMLEASQINLLNQVGVTKNSIGRGLFFLQNYLFPLAARELSSIEDAVTRSVVGGKLTPEGKSNIAKMSLIVGVPTILAGVKTSPTALVTYNALSSIMGLPSLDEIASDPDTLKDQQKTSWDVVKTLLTGGLVQQLTGTTPTAIQNNFATKAYIGLSEINSASDFVKGLSFDLIGDLGTQQPIFNRVNTAARILNTGEIINARTGEIVYTVPEKERLATAMTIVSGLTPDKLNQKRSLKSATKQVIKKSAQEYGKIVFNTARAIQNNQEPDWDKVIKVLERNGKDGETFNNSLRNQLEIMNQKGLSHSQLETLNAANEKLLDYYGRSQE